VESLKTGVVMCSNSVFKCVLKENWPLGIAANDGEIGMFILKRTCKIFFPLLKERLVFK